MTKEERDSAISTGIACIIIGVVCISIAYYKTGVAFIIFGLLVCMGSRKQEEEAETEEAPAETSPQVSITVSVDEEDDDDSDLTFSIKGINYRGLDDSFLGDFVGTARALTSNPHDPYAIGVYVGSRRVGFLPGGNSELHARILSLGGSVDAEGYIAQGEDEDSGRLFYYGKVTLLIP